MERRYTAARSAGPRAWLSMVSACNRMTWSLAKRISASVAGRSGLTKLATLRES